MNRRLVVAGLAGALAWPISARAQQMRRVAIMMANYAQNDREGQASSAAFEETLQSLGWTKGKNIQLDYRWDAGDVARIKVSAADFVHAGADVIVVATNPAVVEVRRLTKTIPVVFTRVADPVGSGFVSGLAQPGGNITGFQASDASLGSKWIGVLKEAVPALARVAVLYGSDSGGNVAFLQAAEGAAGASGVQVTRIDVHATADWQQPVASFARQPNGGLLVVPHPFTTAQRKPIIAAAAKAKLPAIYGYRLFSADGGLISYGPDQIDQWRGAASYVDRILRGEKPGGLPVQAPTKYELVLNLKSAKEIGFAFPQGVLTRADEVIE